jgi:hypothetical protein
MKKIILILSGIFIYNFLFAQNPLYKKRNWGVDFGLNYYYPVIDGYHYSSNWIGSCSQEDYHITLTGNVGKYLGISRTIKLYKINEKNSLNLLIGLSYNERKATLKYSGTNTAGGTINYVNGTEKIMNQYFCLDIKLSGIANIKEKYGIYNAIGFRINNISCNFCEHYLTYSPGFLFYLKKINIMLSMDYLIFNPKSNTHYIHNDIYLFRREYYNLTNFFGISIFFNINNPFKNKKNEEK